MPTEGAKTLRCLSKARTVYRHNSGESLEWAPKVQRCVKHILISQASGQSKTTMIVQLSGPLTNQSIR